MEEQPGSKITLVVFGLLLGLWLLLWTFPLSLWACVFLTLGSLTKRDGPGGSGLKQAVHETARACLIAIGMMATFHLAVVAVAWMFDGNELGRQVQSIETSIVQGRATLDDLLSPAVSALVLGALLVLNFSRARLVVPVAEIRSVLSTALTMLTVMASITLLERIDAANARGHWASLRASRFETELKGVYERRARHQHGRFARRHA